MVHFSVFFHIWYIFLCLFNNIFTIGIRNILLKVQNTRILNTQNIIGKFCIQFTLLYLKSSEYLKWFIHTIVQKFEEPTYFSIQMTIFWIFSKVFSLNFLFFFFKDISINEENVWTILKNRLKLVNLHKKYVNDLKFRLVMYFV